MRNFYNSRQAYHEIIGSVEICERFIVGRNGSVFVMQKTGPKTAVTVHPARLTEFERHEIAELRQLMRDCSSSVQRMLAEMYDADAEIDDYYDSLACFELGAGRGM